MECPEFGVHRMERGAAVARHGKSRWYKVCTTVVVANLRTKCAVLSRSDMYRSLIFCAEDCFLQQHMFANSTTNCCPSASKYRPTPFRESARFCYTAGPVWRPRQGCSNCQVLWLCILSIHTKQVSCMYAAIDSVGEGLFSFVRRVVLSKHQVWLLGGPRSRERPR